MFEVVCPDGRVRHTPYKDPADAQAYACFANRAGEGEIVVGVPCEPNIEVSPRCGVAPAPVQCHWVRVVDTQKPLLESCPVCGAWPTMPEAPRLDMRGPGANGKMRKVAVDVPCPKCPAALTYFVDTGFVCCFTPNQRLKVRVARGR